MSDIGGGSASIPHLWSSALNETHTRMHRSPGSSSDFYGGGAGGVPSPAALPLPLAVPRSSQRQDTLHLKALLKTLPFQCTIAVAVVFTLSFVTLICIQPPFVFNTSKETEDKHETKKFSAAKSALYALGATGVGCLIATGLYVFAYKKENIKPTK